MSRYAISDIHGCYKTFRHLVEEVIKLQPTDELYLLGDYIDRGMNSKGVLDFILNLQRDGFNVRILQGNHEAMLMEAREDFTKLNVWLLNGGIETLSSFHVSSITQIPDVYWELLSKTEYYIELKDYYLVHAGFDFSLPDPFSDYESMLWLRNFEVDADFLGQRRIVHGHTPISLTQIDKSLTDPDIKVINIDSGCVFRQRLGYLSALHLDTLILYSVQNRD